MVKLNDRLQIIADNIIKGETMADIGTDHGFLPLHLWENRICPKIILTDISAGSLDKAKENMRQQYPHEVFDFRNGDGLQVLDYGEVDVVVIAGMGGVLMTKILGENPEKTCGFQKIILQPRNGLGKLRFWLEETGFETRSEHLAKEGNFICEILVLKPPSPGFLMTQGCLPEVSDIEYEIPQALLNPADPLIIPFINKKLKIEKEIQEEIIKGNAGAEGKCAEIEKRIRYLERRLSEVETSWALSWKN